MRSGFDESHLALKTCGICLFLLDANRDVLRVFVSKTMASTAESVF